jgi:hypothetical protein
LDELSEIAIFNSLMFGSRPDAGLPSMTILEDRSGFVPRGVRQLSGRSVGPLTPEHVTVLSLALLGVVLAIVLAAIFGSPLKDDIAWLLHLASDMLRGKRLYVDDIEINPPLIVWILLLPAEVARLSGLQIKIAADLFFAIVVIGASFCSARLLRGYAPLLENQAPVFAGIGTVLLILPGVEFGQREHLLVALALPYLCLVARRLKSHEPRHAAAACCGIAAAIGCALKPDYLIAFAALEAVAISRGARIWRTETVCAAVVLASYAAAVAVIFPIYFSFIIPLARELYGASDVSFVRLLIESHNVLLGLAILLVLCLARPTRAHRDPLLVVLATFALGAIAACLTEQKDWFYHRLPATIVVVLGLTYWIASVLFDRASSKVGRLAGLAIAASAVGAFGGAAADRLEPRLELALGEQKALESHIEDVVEQHHARRYLAFSQSLSPGFPVVDDAGVAWASRFDSMWALRGALWRAHLGERKALWWLRGWIVSDFVRSCPDLVLVDDRDGLDYIGALSVSKEFAVAWSHYQEVASFDGVRIFSPAEANNASMMHTPRGPAGKDTSPCSNDGGARDSLKHTER